MIKISPPSPSANNVDNLNIDNLNEIEIKKYLMNIFSEKAHISSFSLNQINLVLSLVSKIYSDHKFIQHSKKINVFKQFDKKKLELSPPSPLNTSSLNNIENNDPAQNESVQENVDAKDSSAWDYNEYPLNFVKVVNLINLFLYETNKNRDSVTTFEELTNIEILKNILDYEFEKINLDLNQERKVRIKKSLFEEVIISSSPQFLNYFLSKIKLDEQSKYIDDFFVENIKEINDNPHYSNEAIKFSFMDSFKPLFLDILFAKTNMQKHAVVLKYACNSETIKYFFDKDIKIDKNEYDQIHGKISKKHWSQSEIRPLVRALNQFLIYFDKETFIQAYLQDFLSGSEDIAKRLLSKNNIDYTSHDFLNKLYLVRFETIINKDPHSYSKLYSKVLNFLRNNKITKDMFLYSDFDKKNIKLDMLYNYIGMGNESDRKYLDIKLKEKYVDYFLDSFYYVNKKNYQILQKNNKSSIIENNYFSRFLIKCLTSKDETIIRKSLTVFEEAINNISNIVLPKNDLDRLTSKNYSNMKNYNYYRTVYDKQNIIEQSLLIQNKFTDSIITTQKEYINSTMYELNLFKSIETTNQNNNIILEDETIKNLFILFINHFLFDEFSNKYNTWNNPKGVSETAKIRNDFIEQHKERIVQNKKLLNEIVNNKIYQILKELMNDISKEKKIVFEKMILYFEANNINVNVAPKQTRKFI